MSVPPDPIEAIRARHKLSTVASVACIREGQLWPCDTFVVLGALDSALADLSAIAETLDRAQGDLIAHRDCLGEKEE